MHCFIIGTLRYEDGNGDGNMQKRKIALINENKSCTLECSVADHLLTVVFTDTPRKVHFWGSVDNVDNLYLHLRLNLVPFSVRES